MLKNLEPHIDVTLWMPTWATKGTFARRQKELQIISLAIPISEGSSANATYTGVTVPVLWDKKLGTIVNNESSEIFMLITK